MIVLVLCLFLTVGCVALGLVNGDHLLLLMGVISTLINCFTLYLRLHTHPLP